MNTTRRDFLAAASLAKASVPAWGAPSPNRTGDAASLIIVCDEQLADSRAYALRALMTGARVVPLRDDIGMLWWATLMPRAASPGHVLAGLTRHADAFLLAGFAQGIGMRMTRRAQADALVAWRLERLEHRT
jgi:hypothetical protein